MLFFEMMEEMHVGLCHWCLAQSSGNPCNFLGDRSVLCSQEATLSGLLGDSWVRADHQKDQVMKEAGNF